MKSLIRNMVFAVLAGVFFVYVCAWTLGYTAAITMPYWYAELLQGATLRWVLFFVWDFIVVQMLGAGLLCFILIYSFITLFKLHRVIFPVFFLTVYLLFIYVVDIHSMRMLGAEFALTLSWLMHPLVIVISLISATVVAKCRVKNLH